MIRHLNMRSRLWLAAGLPAVLAILALLLLFLQRHGQELSDAWSERGRSAARQMASAAEFSLFTGNQDGLQRLVDASLAGDMHMQGAAILSPKGRALVSTGRFIEWHFVLDGQEHVRVNKQRLWVITPIRETALDEDDLFAKTGLQPEIKPHSQVLGYAFVEIRLDVLAQSQRDMVMWALGISAVVLLLAGLLSAVIAASVIRPISNIRNQVARLRDGELHVRINVRDTGVLADLAQGINEMAERMAVTQDQLREQVMLATHELREQKEAAELLARVDPLTGLSTRRAFTEMADVEIQRALRYGVPLSLIMLDLDRFKSVNDTFGHVGGDAVLIDFSHILGQEVREIDVVGRLGGEEFAVLLPNTPLDEAVAVAERMRAAVERSTVLLQGQTLRYTVSLGVAQFVPAEQSLSSFLGRADVALYRAKRQGRNRVEQAAPDWSQA